MRWVGSGGRGEIRDPLSLLMERRLTEVGQNTLEISYLEISFIYDELIN